jgi:hypothetical protein
MHVLRQEGDLEQAEDTARKGLSEVSSNLLRISQGDVALFGRVTDEFEQVLRRVSRRD